MNAAGGEHAAVELVHVQALSNPDTLKLACAWFKGNQRRADSLPC